MAKTPIFATQNGNMQGKTLNGFILQRLLGTGGMAEVWYAENDIHKRVAVKILNRDLSYNETVVKRFRREAEIMVQLEHPNIRSADSLGEIDGRPAMIMEYLEGTDLKKMLGENHRFTQEELVKWWNQLVDALNYAHNHELKVVHRDIKPSNIFIDKKGNVKLLDFGVAKIKESIHVTMTGATMGTLMYMSPEQADNAKEVTSASDAYSLAVTFVHLLTGKAPYSDTSSERAILNAIAEEPLDLSGVPKEWRRFLTQYLEKDPSKRLALRPFPTPTAPSEDRHKRKKPGDNQVAVHESLDEDKTVIDEQTIDDVPAKFNGKKHWTKKRKKRLSLFAAVCALIVVLWSFTGIKGTVTEKSDKDLVLPGATIIAIHKNSGKEYFDVADEKGHYKKWFMFPGKYRIQCRYVGFQINEQEIYVLGRKKVDFAMYDGIFTLAEQEQKALDHEYVDLSLPSSTLWANCNVGAYKPEDYGDYYAWGETSTKSNYAWSTYKYANGAYNKLTKYCDSSYYGNNGFTDSLTALQASDDPAMAQWGGSWRTPSKAQWEELLANTTHKWTTRNGKQGRQFTSKKNGNTLFLPAAGNCWGSSVYAGSHGDYWSRLLFPDNPCRAWCLDFSSDSCGMKSIRRDGGFCVRPVREK